MGSGGASEFVDPYTGASRYTGGGAGSSQIGGGSSASTGFSGDPYTGEYDSRVTGWVLMISQFSGGGRTTPAAASASNLLPHVCRLLCSYAVHFADRVIAPQRKFLSFAQANLPALRTKVVQLNTELSADPVRIAYGCSAELKLTLSTSTDDCESRS